MRHRSPDVGRSTATSTAATSRDLGKNGIFIALIAVVVLFPIPTDGILLRPQNISNLIVQNGYILILAIGMVMVIIAGHIDLSVGSVAAFVGACPACDRRQLGHPVVARRSSCRLVVGALVGAWQGFWIAYVGIPAFIVTLAGMLIFRGLALVVLGNQQIIGSFPTEYRALGNGFLPDLFGGTARSTRSPSIIGVVAIVALVVQQVRTAAGAPEVRPGGRAARLVRRQARAVTVGSSAVRRVRCSPATRAPRSC